MLLRDLGCRFVLALWPLFPAVATAAAAAIPVHVVQTDLRPLIAAAVQSRVQFAVSVPHSASPLTAGSWTTDGESAIWRYAVRVPTAVSLSFHAVQSVLPAGSVLVVRGARTVTSYRAGELHRGELWSRIYPGDSLELTLTVPIRDRAAVAFNITSLQAGYRSLGAGVIDHPYYRKLITAQAGGSGNASCVTNYLCQITANNTPNGAATVALVVGDLYQCSGVLINDVPGSNTPYLLTARHCETGTLGGGNPGAASTVTVYWDATTSCGQALGSIYDSSVQTQTGAGTVVEQQDAWLIKLDQSPVVSDAQFAGFDASGGGVTDGYTVHHAEGYDKQFAGWFGQAATVQASGVLGTSYVSNFLETVNQVGNIAPGASGSGLFDQNDHLVGALTLGRQTSDPSGYEACPAQNPSAPNGANGAADFTSLAAVWNSTADASSSTGSTTLASVLDPGNTGSLVSASKPEAGIAFSGHTTDLFFVGNPAVIQWSAANAISCTASGGTSGDGWSGSVPVNGSQSVTETTTGTVTYVLRCQFPGSQTGSAAISFQWVNEPEIQVNAPFVVWTSRPVTLSWDSNVSPCSISGGSVSLNNLAASGSTTTTQATAGDVTYTFSCGPVNNSTTTGVLVHYVTPSLLFEANGTDRLLGQTFFLQWITQADSCVPSGGAPNDGWATTAIHSNDDASRFSPNVGVAGTYTYTLTCSSGSISIQQSVTVTFENNAPYVTATLTPDNVNFSASPADYSSLTWNSNLSSCTLNTVPSLPAEAAPSPPFDSNTPFASLPLPQGSLSLAPAVSGSYTITVSCTSAALGGASASSGPLTLTVNAPVAPTATITFNPTTVLAGQSFSISWTSTNTQSCTESGGIPNETWGSNSIDQAPAGSVTEQAQSGTFTFGLTCPSIDPSQAPATAETTLSIQALTATLTPANTSVNTGSSFTLNWSSTAATGCSASGGGANGASWSGALATAGMLTQTATTPGSYTYTLTCNAGGEMVTQEAMVSVTAPSGGSSGGHGGGALGVLDLVLLAAGSARCLRRKHILSVPAAPPRSPRYLSSSSSSWLRTRAWPRSDRRPTAR
jgi:hypothetical protein